MKRTLSAKQAAALAVTLYYPILAKVMIPLTAGAGAMAFVAPILAAIPIFLQAYLLKKLRSSCKNMSCGEILKTLFGQKTARWLLILLSLWLILSAAGYMEYYDELLTTTIYPDAKHDLMPFLMAVLVGILLPKGLRTLGRMNWLIAAVVLVQMAVLLLLTVPKCDLMNLLPLNGPGLLRAGAAAPVTASAVGGVAFTVFLVHDEVRERPEDARKNSRRRKALYIGAWVLPAVLLFALGAAFGGPVLMSLDWPVLSVVREIFDLESAASLEPLFIAIWFYADFMSVAVQGYLAVRLLGEAFDIRDLQKLLPGGIILILSVTLCFSGGVEEMRLLTAGFLLPVRFGISFGLPVLCWFRGRKKGLFPLQEGKNMVE